MPGAPGPETPGGLLKKHTTTALALAAVLGVGGIGTAVAVGGAPAPTAGQTLSSYMGGDAAQWDKVQTWIEAEYGQGANPTPTQPAPSPTPTPSPAPAQGIESGEVKWTTTGATFTGKIRDTVPGDRVQLRVDTKELTGQRGFYEYELVRADGTVSITLADYTSPQPKLFWHLAKGGSELAYGTVVASGTVSQPATAPAPEPTPTTPPASGEGTTGGTGGALTNATFQSFTSNGLTSDYHLYAAGLDWSKPVGLLMYGDGSGGFGFDNPTQSYLIGGTNGLAAVAKKHNMVLVVPEAPAPGCDGTDNCWYDSSHAAKAKWASDLMTRVKGQYNIDKARIVIGGYSSGAQWTTQSFLPAHGEAQSVDLAVPIAYGGAPRSTMQASAAWKNDVVISWDAGTADEAYTTASYGAVGGYNWYKAQGFKTDYVWPAGVGHGRSGQFGGIVGREITQHLGG